MKARIFSCIGLLALIGFLSFPPGAMADIFDNADYSLSNQNPVLNFVPLIDQSPVVFSDQRMFCSTDVSHDYTVSCTPIIAWSGKGGAAPAFSKPRSFDLS